MFYCAVTEEPENHLAALPAQYAAVRCGGLGPLIAAFLAALW